jgi:surfeit locus 1 family protein
MTLKHRRWVVALAALLAAGVTARLGWWQLDRADQKIARQMAMTQREALPPLAWQAVASDAEGLEAQRHRRVLLQGHWQHSATVYLDNRPMAGRAGFFVVTPLTLPDGRSVAVQRGWVPRDPLDRTRVASPTLPAGLVSVEGRMAGPPSRLFDFDAPDGGLIRQNLDLSQYASEHRLRLLPTSVQQEAPPGAAGEADGLLRDWPKPATGVAKHHGYAFQWFALSALIVGLYLWFQIIRPRRQKTST